MAEYVGEYVGEQTITVNETELSVGDDLSFFELNPYQQVGGRVLSINRGPDGGTEFEVCTLENGMLGCYTVHVDRLGNGRILVEHPDIVYAATVVNAALSFGEELIRHANSVVVEVEAEEEQR